jgi:hypothetical protein
MLLAFLFQFFECVQFISQVVPAHDQADDIECQCDEDDGISRIEESSGVGGGHNFSPDLLGQLQFELLDGLGEVADADAVPE